MKGFVIAILVTLLSSLEVAYAQDESVTYLVTFQSTWSQQTHPHPAGADQFPSNAHFSPLVGAAHNDNGTFWAPDALAGSNVYTTITGPALSISPGTATIDAITTSRAYPLITLVTMIAPSPDWFVGVANLSLLDSNDQWRDEIVVMLYPYDAGSDDGTDYRSPDVEPASHHLIATMRGQTPFSDAPIGTITFRRQKQVYLPLVTHRE